MGLFRNISLQQLYQGAVHTFLKYPLVLLSATTGTVAAIIRIDIPYDKQHLYQYLNKLILVSALGLILFFVLELVVRRYKFSLAERVMLWVAGLLFLMLYFLLLPGYVEERQYLRFLMLELVLHLAASYAMFVNQREENAFWQFNKSLFLRILTSALYAAVLFIGLTIAVAAVDKLFSVDVPDNFYAKLWLCMVGIFNTWFFLAGVPVNVPELEQSHTYPKGLKVFTQFVLLPLVTLYLVILYLYFGKIVLQWEWPQGWVSVLVLCFSIAGVLSLLLIHPIRFEAGNAWMRTFSRWFYRALFPLIILLILAIWRRVSEYGITEPRYVVMALALWLFCTALYFLLNSQKNIKFIPVTLSLVALITAFGPFNAFQVSAWSQTNRLEELLQQSGVLVNGQVQAKHPEVKNKVAQEVSSITRYLAGMHDLRDLQPWFRQDLDAILASKADSAWNQWNRAEEQAEAIVALMGIEYSIRYGATSTDEILYFSSMPNGNGSEVFNVKGYDYGMYFSPVTNEEDESREEYNLDSWQLVVKLDRNSGKLYFQATNETIILDLIPIIKQLEKKRHSPRNQEEMIFKAAGKHLAVQLVLHELYVDKKANYRIGNMNGYLFVKQKD